MKKETIEKFMPLMQAMLEGKTIQYRFVYGRGKTLPPSAKSSHSSKRWKRK